MGTLRLIASVAAIVVAILSARALLRVTHTSRCVRHAGGELDKGGTDGSPAMEDEEFLKERREAIKESIAFFGADRKFERELWVANRFVENLNVGYREEEFIHVRDDPPDVVFRDARFEVKEIMDAGRRRHDEYRASSRRADKATSPRDVLTSFTPRDTSIQAVYELVLSASVEYHARYAEAVCQGLDLLFYVNLKDVMGLTVLPFPDVSALHAHPWRSVSFVMGAHACVLTATDRAPLFMRRV